jgi:ectoine hydroxylase-related dioxygenase (phytanoyl-CoA dioxygenase family)
MITSQQREALHEDGYVLVPDLLSAGQLRACRQELSQHFPTCEQLLADPDRYAKAPRAAFFPYAGSTLNEVSTHPALIDLVERLLGTEDIRMGDCVLQAKYGALAGGGRDQSLHNDAWEGSSLVYPSERGIFQRIFAIVYLTDVTADLAPTHVVAHSDGADAPLVTEAGLASYTRDDHPWLYDAERPVLAPAGSALITTGRTIHRGSAVRAERGERFALFVNFHAAAATWQRSRTFVGLPGAPEGPAARRFMSDATPKQRQLLGFPPPGHDYWSEETLRRVGEIYPDMDLAPYIHAIAASSSSTSGRSSGPAEA